MLLAIGAAFLNFIRPSHKGEMVLIRQKNRRILMPRKFAENFVVSGNGAIEELPEWINPRMEKSPHDCFWMIAVGSIAFCAHDLLVDKLPSIPEVHIGVANEAWLGSQYEKSGFMSLKNETYSWESVENPYAKWVPQETRIGWGEPIPKSEGRPKFHQLVSQLS